MNHKPNKFFLLSPLLCLMSLPLFSHWAKGQDPSSPFIPIGNAIIDNFKLGPNCGVYCAMAALRALGLEAPYGVLVSPQYVSSLEGSSMADLILAVKDHGAFPLPLRGLTPSGLVALETPCILHVRRDGTTEAHAHWVLFLGMEDGKAKLFNPPHGEELLPLAELLYLWDGQGIAVFAQKPSQTISWKVKIVQILDSVQMLALAFLGICLGFLPWPQRLPLSTYSGFGLRLGLVTLLCLLLQLPFSQASLQDRWKLYASISLAREKQSFDSISAMELQNRLNDPQMVLVDARIASNFQVAHLPGAYSLPIDCGPGMVRTVANQIGNKTIVVYCQSDGCDWSEVIAKSLSLRGVGPIHIYRGGIEEWTTLQLPLVRP